jgi:hypothetical protein
MQRDITPSKLDDPEIVHIRNRIMQLHDERKRLHDRLRANEDDLKAVTDKLGELLGMKETSE